MDRFKIERYFTSIGRSFYSGDEYRDLEIEYKPISNFGIGFLSAFMVCREIDVRTRYYLEEADGLKLHIPNYDGCFFIEKDNQIDIGTEITLYIDKKTSKNITFESIIEYICKTIRDINCNIHINNESTKECKIITNYAAKNTINSKNLIFVPFLETGNISSIKVQDCIWTNNFKNEYPYGLLINLGERSKGYEGVLNSGILLCDTNVRDVWRMLAKVDEMNNCPRNMFLFNFPSNYIDIDVAREKINGFAKDILSKEFIINLIDEILTQIQQYFDLAQNNNLNISAYNMHSLMMFLARFCSGVDDYKHLNKKIMSGRYVLSVRFNFDSIELIVMRNGCPHENSILYTNNNIKKYKEELFTFVGKQDINDYNLSSRQLYRLLDELRYYSYEETDNLTATYGYGYFWGYSHEKYLGEKIKMIISKELKIKESNLTCAVLLVLQAVFAEREERKYIDPMNAILILLLEKYSISDVEQDNAKLIINKADIEKIIKRMTNKNL